MLALTWNLYHGRSPEHVGRSLLDEFATALAGWEWDVALLQEVPPWWPPALAMSASAQARWVLTSRNFGLALRRAISARDPDVLKANGGGCNAILVRGPIHEHRSARLTWSPERRWTHGVRLRDGSWVVNLHASTGRRALRDTERALAAARRWSGSSPLLFGGDVNVPYPAALAGMVHLGGNHVDHLYANDAAARKTEVLEHGRLSDHAPLRVNF